MNTVFVINPDIYSCAVDAFLEISTHLFLRYLPGYQIYLLGMILETCFSMLVHIICLREKTVHY